MISELQVGSAINNEIFYCISKSTNIAKNGSAYFNVVLRDSSGQIDAKIWDTNDPNIHEFNSKSFVKVTGTVSSFKDANQIIISSISEVPQSDVNITDFCPISPKSVDEMWNKLFEYIESVTNEYNLLLKHFFLNETIANRFKNNSAAKTVHHAYIGGLLEHTLAVTEICDKLSSLYPTIDRNLLITAAICHDIGKIKEISSFPENDYSDEGNLLGHIYLGAEMIDRAVRSISQKSGTQFPVKLANNLKHCILAHHGGLEYGSPKVPSLIEATALSFADDTDAKLRRFEDLLKDTTNNDWSEKTDYFLGAKFRKTL